MKEAILVSLTLDENYAHLLRGDEIVFDANRVCVLESCYESSKITLDASDNEGFFTEQDFTTVCILLARALRTDDLPELVEPSP